MTFSSNLITESPMEMKQLLLKSERKNMMGNERKVAEEVRVQRILQVLKKATSGYFYRQRSCELLFRRMVSILLTQILLVLISE